MENSLVIKKLKRIKSCLNGSSWSTYDTMDLIDKMIKEIDPTHGIHKSSKHPRAKNNTEEYNNFLDELKYLMGAPHYTAKWKDGTTRVKWFYFGSESKAMKTTVLSFINAHKADGIHCNEVFRSGLNVYVPKEFRFGNKSSASIKFGKKKRKTAVRSICDHSF